MDQSDPQYAVMRTIRITSPSHAYWVGAHNKRDMPVPNLEDGKPVIQVFVGGASVRDDLRAAMDKFAPRRKGDDAVLGLEFVFSASRAAFENLSARARRRKALRLVHRVRRYLRQRYPHEGQIVSIVLHLDERTPHVHAVVLPVYRGVDQRSGERVYYVGEDGKRRWRTKDPEAREEVWMLSAAKDMGGKRQLAIHQTQWAKMCEDIGLSRGRERSGGRNISNREHEALLAAALARAEALAAEHERGIKSLEQQRARHDARVAIDEAGLDQDRAYIEQLTADLRDRGAQMERDRSAISVETDRLSGVAVDLDAKRAALDTEAQAQAAKVRDADAALARRRDEIEAEMAERSKRANEWSAMAKRYKRDLHDERAELAEIERTLVGRERMVEIRIEEMDKRSAVMAGFADLVFDALDSLDLMALPAEIRRRYYHLANNLGAEIDVAGRIDPHVRELQIRREIPPVAASRK